MSIRRSVFWRRVLPVLLLPMLSATGGCKTRAWTLWDAYSMRFIDSQGRVFDPKAEWVYRAAEGKSKSRNTPFDGWTMQGKVHWTISEGRIAYAAPRS